MSSFYYFEFKKKEATMKETKKKKQMKKWTINDRDFKGVTAIFYVSKLVKLSQFFQLKVKKDQIKLKIAHSWHVIQFWWKIPAPIYSSLVIGKMKKNSVIWKPT